MKTPEGDTRTERVKVRGKKTRAVRLVGPNTDIEPGARILNPEESGLLEEIRAKSSNPSPFAKRPRDK